MATVLLAYPVAYFIAFHAGTRRGLWLTLVTLPFYTSYLLRVFAWKVILGYNGILNSAMVALHVPGAPFSGLLYNPGAVVVTLAHAYAAFAVLPIYVALSAIKPKLAEAGLDLGAPPFTVFRRVIFPLSLPGVVESRSFLGLVERVQLRLTDDQVVILDLPHRGPPPPAVGEAVHLALEPGTTRLFAPEDL